MLDDAFKLTLDQIFPPLKQHTTNNTQQTRKVAEPAGSEDQETTASSQCPQGTSAPHQNGKDIFKVDG
jgi:hypothetical protein